MHLSVKTWLSILENKGMTLNQCKETEGPMYVTD